MEVKTEDFYHDQAITKYDTFDNWKDYYLLSWDNKKVISKMKDVCARRRILEYVGLRPKMYRIQEASGANIKMPKGVQQNVVNKGIRHEKYK